MLAVCREFRRLYHDNARAATLVEGGLSVTAAVQRCPTLRRLTVLRGIASWLTGSLTRLQRLEVPAGWPVVQILV